MSEFASRDQIIEDVEAFHRSAWEIALHYQGLDAEDLTVVDRPPHAKEVHAGDGMVVDILRPDESSPLDLGATFADLVKEGVIDPDTADAVQAEVREQLNGTLELGMVVIDDRPCIAREYELNPLLFSGLTEADAEAFQARCQQAVRDLMELGAVESKDDFPPEMIPPKILALRPSRGFRIVGRSVNATDSDSLDFPWQGIRGEMPGSSIHSMEGDKSNLVRAVILEAVRRRLNACLPLDA